MRVTGVTGRKYNLVFGTICLVFGMYMWCIFGIKIRINAFFVFLFQSMLSYAQYDRGCDRKGLKAIFHFI